MIVLGITYKDKYKRKMILMKQDWVKPNYADLAKQFNFNCKTVKKYFESSVENLKSTSLKNIYFKSI